MELGSGVEWSEGAGEIGSGSGGWEISVWLYGAI